MRNIIIWILSIVISIAVVVGLILLITFFQLATLITVCVIGLLVILTGLTLLIKSFFD